MNLKVVWDNGYEETQENVISIRIIKGELLIAKNDTPTSGDIFVRKDA